MFGTFVQKITCLPLSHLTSRVKIYLQNFFSDKENILLYSGTLIFIVSGCWIKLL